MIDGDLIFFNADESYAFTRDDAFKAIHYEDERYLEASLPVDSGKIIAEQMYVGYYDCDNQFILFCIHKPVEDVIQSEISFTADIAAIAELEDVVIEDKRPSNCQAGAAVNVALTGTEWHLGIAEATEIATNSFYYQSVWKSLCEIQETYGCYFRFRVELTDDGISGRYVDVLSNIGRDAGLRFEVGKNVDGLKVSIDDSQTCTALYGLGKGEEVGVSSSGDPTYGRRINFEDVVWAVADGDPCDKPAGQGYVEDVEATATVGRNGKPRTKVIKFDDCTDPEELLRLTWAELQIRKQPSVSVSATVRDIERIKGYAGEAIRLGDYATVILDDTRHVSARVVSIQRNLLNPADTQIKIGSVSSNITDMQATSASELEKQKDSISIGAGIAAKNPDLYNGILNTMVTRILSTGTNIDTDPTDGSLIFTAPDGNSAVKLTGGGILISKKKVGDKFEWTTALTGEGITASVLNTGVLNASLIRILGSNSFYWDAQAIFIYDEADRSQSRQIRIGLYDGKHYGIGYTTDGGKTWQSAIGFNGVILGAGTVGKNNLSQELKNELETIRGVESITEYYLASELSSGVSTDSDGWSTEMQTMTEEKPYLWNYELITYTNGTSSKSEPVVIGIKGTDGSAGIGVSSIASKYGLSSSVEEQPKEWYDSLPADSGDALYLWSYEIISFSDGTVKETEPRISGYLGNEQITISASAPSSPADDDLWLDTASSPPTLKRYDELKGWEECTVSRAELDNMSKRISSHDSKFILVDEKISAKVSQTDYAADMAGKANTDDVKAQFDAAADLTAKNLLLKFAEAQKYTDDKSSAFDEFRTDVLMYFEFSTAGLLIGKKDSDFKTRITNEKMSFMQGSDEVAFIQYNRMYITEARITDRLSIGTEENGYFDWVTTEDGLGLKWK